MKALRIRHALVFALALVLSSSVVSQQNSNKKAQQPTPKQTTPPVKKSTKIGETEKTTYTKLPSYQYVINKVEVNAVTLAFKVNIKNTGGPAHSGTVMAQLIAMTPEQDPKSPSKFKEVYCPYTPGFGNNSPWVGPPILRGIASVPALKSGESVWVEGQVNYIGNLQKVEIKSLVDFATQNTCGAYSVPVEDQLKYKWALWVKAKNDYQMANLQMEVKSGAWIH